MQISVNNSVRDIKRYFIKSKCIFMWAPQESIWLCLIPNLLLGTEDSSAEADWSIGEGWTMPDWSRVTYIAP